MEKAYNLRDVVDGVPEGTRPLYWNSKRDSFANLNSIDTWIDEYVRQGLVPKGARIDEAAVMVPSGWHANKFLEGRVLEGWEHFNGCHDLVYTNPFGTRYVVRYEFLRHPGVSYRLEVMYTDYDDEGVSGFSPLHQALWLPSGIIPVTSGAHLFPVPHLSFKAPGNPTDRQPRAAYSRAVAHLQSKGCLQAQTCQSTYGVFGYYLPHDAQRQLYIKPRVNLRDHSIMHGMCTIENHDGCIIP